MSDTSNYREERELFIYWDGTYNSDGSKHERVMDGFQFTTLISDFPGDFFATMEQMEKTELTQTSLKARIEATQDEPLKVDLQTQLNQSVRPYGEVLKVVREFVRHLFSFEPIKVVNGQLIGLSDQEGMNLLASYIDWQSEEKKSTDGSLISLQTSDVLLTPTSTADKSTESGSTKSEHSNDDPFRS